MRGRIMQREVLEREGGEMMALQACESLKVVRERIKVMGGGGGDFGG